jgi:tRNA U34 5-carboxymethylaminomethyl modifying enzyme MnmG/GidA
VIDRSPLGLHGAVQQARWLAELSAALDQASKVTMMLCDYSDGGCEASAVRAQIHALGAEVEAIQRR